MDKMKATEGIEEIQRRIAEYGDVPLVIVDEMEPGWKYPVTDVEFDPEDQVLVISANR